MGITETALDRYLALEMKKARLERLMDDVELDMDVVWREMSGVEQEWVNRRDE